MRTGKAEMTRSFSWMLMTFTPWALRPVTRMSSTRVRMTVPFSVSTISSSLPPTRVRVTSGPVLSVTSSVMTPRPPRPLLG